MASECSHCGAPQRGAVCGFCGTLFPGATPEPTFGAHPEVLAAIDAGNLIEAIKRHRHHTRLGLADAKDAVEEIARTRGKR